MGIPGVRDTEFEPVTSRFTARGNQTAIPFTVAIFTLIKVIHLLTALFIATSTIESSLFCLIY
jgi:hypothetical protein